MSGLALSFLGVIGVAATVTNALILLVAGLSKLRNRGQLPGVITNYRLLPDTLVGPVAAGLPFVELAVAVGLIAGLRPAVLAAIGLLCLFALAMAINIRRGRAHIDCGCGRSELRQPLSVTLVLRNLVLALALVPAFGSLPAAGSGQWLIGAAAGTAGYVLLLVCNALAGLAAQARLLERKT